MTPKDFEIGKIYYFHNPKKKQKYYRRFRLKINNAQLAELNGTFKNHTILNIRILSHEDMWHECSYESLTKSQREIYDYYFPKKMQLSQILDDYYGKEFIL